MWTTVVEELLDKMRDTIPAEGMMGEVHYWRDLSRILEGVSGEIKQPQVEVTVQLLLEKSLEGSLDYLANDVQSFTRLKSRVLKGSKEAKWNSKYMRAIEQPVRQVEEATDLFDIQLVIAVLLRSLKKIFDSSNFYREARMVSFIDRLLKTIIKKVQRHLSLQIVVYDGVKNYQDF
mmetsp:Transcript_5222/g.8083  ORF Transcript_5222/g.8083 Transcript_5222/m.8083 type:complete len:176 (+) Transcript_5222:451-978(+)